jgi:hypothetical protein
MARGDWPSQFGELASFLYTPARWARRRGVQWTSSLGREWGHLLWKVYSLAGVPHILSDGTRSILPTRRTTLSPLAPSMLRLFESRALATKSSLFNRYTRRPLSLFPKSAPRKSLGLTAFFEPSPETLLGEMRKRSPELASLLQPLYGAYAVAVTRRWKLCPLCGRAFPASRKAICCPPCQARWTRRQRQRRIAQAPKDPVIYRYRKTDDGEIGGLSLALGLAAPATLKRIAGQHTARFRKKKEAEKRKQAALATRASISRAQGQGRFGR